MFCMVADKLILNLMEKNRFVCKCISLSSINHVANCSLFPKRTEHSCIGIFVLNQEQLNNCFFPTKTREAFVHLDYVLKWKRRAPRAEPKTRR